MSEGRVGLDLPPGMEVRLGVENMVMTMMGSSM